MTLLLAYFANLNVFDNYMNYILYKSSIFVVK